MKSSTVWRKVSLLLCVITILCCFRNGDTACDQFTQCHLTYPDDNIRCSVRERGNLADSCYGIDSMLHSCHCNEEGLTLNLHESNGKDSFTCTPNATWDDEFFKLSCTAKPCDAPIRWDNSLVLIPDQTSYANGTEVTFRCVEGFELSGDTLSVVCNYGNWSSYQYPKCTAKPCDAPILWDISLVPIPDQTSYANGTEVTFRCEEGFELSGDTLSVVCKYGNWSSYQYPKCTAKPCDASILWGIFLVTIPDQTSYANGTEVTFRCEELFALSGDTLIVVCNYGNWSSYQSPNCTAEPCDAPILWDISLVLIPDQTSYANGTEVTFRCEEWFELSGDTLSVVCNCSNWSSYEYPNFTDWLLKSSLLLVTCGFLTAGFFAFVCFKYHYHRTGSMIIKPEPTLEVPSDNQQTYISKLNFEMSDPKDGYKNEYSSTSPKDNNEAIADLTNSDTLPSTV